MSNENAPSREALPPLADSLKNTLPPLPDRGRNALPAWGGPSLETKHEYSEAPYKNAVTSFADALTKQ